MNSSSLYESDVAITSKHVYVIGDIHGRANQLVEKLNDLEPGALIILGDVGFGFSLEIDEKLQNAFCQCEEKGWSIYLVRGNHDNPEYWRNIQRGCVMLRENRVITINGKRFYVSGGGISLDRWQRVPRQSYWFDEYIYVPPQVLREVKDIYGILSHVGPTPPKVAANPTFLEYCKLYDPELEADLENEHIQITRLMGLGPKVWYYGHFHVNESFQQGDTTCHALGIATISEIKD